MIDLNLLVLEAAKKGIRLSLSVPYAGTIEIRGERNGYVVKVMTDLFQINERSYLFNSEAFTMRLFENVARELDLAEEQRYLPTTKQTSVSKGES